MNKYFTKRNIIIGIIALLLLVNLSAITTMLYMRWLKPPFPPKADKMMEHAEIRMHHYMQDKLNFSANQMDDFMVIKESFRNESSKLMNDIHKYNREIILELKNDKPNIDKLKHFAEEIGKNHASIKEMTIKHYLELKSLCNPEQYDALNVFFEKLLEKTEHGHPFHNPKYKNRNGEEPQNHYKFKNSYNKNDNGYGYRNRNGNGNSNGYGYRNRNGNGNGNGYGYRHRHGGGNGNGCGNGYRHRHGNGNGNNPKWQSSKQDTTNN